MDPPITVRSICPFFASFRALRFWCQRMKLNFRLCLLALWSLMLRSPSGSRGAPDWVWICRISPRPLRGPWMEVLKEGEDVLLLATGTGVQLATEAAGRLAEMGIKAGVVNARRVNPLAESGLEELLERYSHVVTVEENVLAGGFGSAVLEFAQETRLTCHVGRVGLPNRFIAHGDMASLKAEIGYTVEGVVGEAARLMGVDVTRA